MPPAVVIGFACNVISVSMSVIPVPFTSVDATVLIQSLTSNGLTSGCNPTYCATNPAVIGQEKLVPLILLIGQLLPEVNVFQCGTLTYLPGAFTVFALP